MFAALTCDVGCTMDRIPDVWKTWVCPQCTFLNLQKDDECLVCDGPQDPGAAGEEGKGDVELKQDCLMKQELKHEDGGDGDEADEGDEGPVSRKRKHAMEPPRSYFAGCFGTGPTHITLLRRKWQLDQRNREEKKAPPSPVPPPPAAPPATPEMLLFRDIAIPDEGDDYDEGDDEYDEYDEGDEGDEGDDDEMEDDDDELAKDQRPENLVRFLKEYSFAFPGDTPDGLRLPLNSQVY